MRIEYIINRTIHSIIVFVVVTSIVFFVPRLSPRTPIELFAEAPTISQDTIRDLMTRFGLDKPLWEQFYLFWVNLFRGDMGVSFSFYPRPVMDVLAQKLPWTLLIVGISTTLRSLIGIMLGIIAAWRRGNKADITIQTVSLAFLSMPVFWFAMVALLAFAFYLPWFPTGGAVTPGATYANTFEFVSDVANHAFLPMLVMTITMFAGQVVVMRNTMVEVLDEDYIVTATAKGLTPREVEYRHAARNALLPSVTYVALTLGMVVSGAIFVETVFSYPGMGSLLYYVVFRGDYPLLTGIVLISSTFVIVANFAVDVLYGYLDPRIKY